VKLEICRAKEVWENKRNFKCSRTIH